ncbi:uncharacterized protein LOC111311695 [Durio zibethinus]|uniref:Uncharacterized protein LOC111311695 n=1 Tax=Durio zibethinus TaxID=66656 RepID=A0A6P6AQH4_DURZI|nr:uncharacterized protein LOC111311695 [Durio zibethinus]
MLYPKEKKKKKTTTCIFILIRISLGHFSFQTSLMASALRQPLHASGAIPPVQLSYPMARGISSLPVVFVKDKKQRSSKLSGYYGHRHRNLIVKLVGKASPGKDDIMPAADDPEDGVSLGTMRLPSNTDLQRFETLLFQWANSLCQGANLPLPVPLKIDKIPGGARLGFITIGDGKTEVLVYIDCLVFPATDGSGPIFRAIRNGPLKDQSPPGEPRIMRSLLQALQKNDDVIALLEQNIR